MRKTLLSFAVFVAAFGILSVSVLQSASVSYVFATPVPRESPTLVSKTSLIDYELPYSGSVLPDSFFWNLKSLRDRVWYWITINPMRKAELALLFSDKRLVASESMFEIKKPDIGLSTLSKGEKYLEIATNEEMVARNKGYDTSEFLKKLSLASLKHRQIIEENIITNAPEDAKPTIVKIEDYAKNTYKSSRDALNSKGLPIPKNPFVDQ